MEILKNDNIKIYDLHKRLDKININLKKHFLKNNNISTSKKLEEVRQNSNLNTAEHMTFAHF